MKAIEILRKLHWSDILPDLVKVRDGYNLCEDLKEKPDYYSIINGQIRENAWYLLLRDCLVDVFFDDDPVCYVARINYMGRKYVCVEIDE